jgi:hypothetical protein
MVNLARQRLGEDADLHVADLAAPVPFAREPPAVYEIVYPDADYFALTEYSEEYTFDGQSAALTFWHDHCTP